MSDKKIIAVVGATGSQGGGLVRAIFEDKTGKFSARAITRDANSEKSKELKSLGAEVVRADIDDFGSLKKAFDGAYGAFCVTFYWNHLSPEKENSNARNMAEAAKAAGVKHVVWSTLEDTRQWIPLSDDRMPTLMGKYKVPHFDAKGESDKYFTNLGLPVTLLRTTFYWDNFLRPGSGPVKIADGKYSLSLPMGSSHLGGIAAEDIGKCALGIFRHENEFIGRTVGIAGEFLTGNRMAEAMSRSLGVDIVYNEIAPSVYRSFGFPGAGDMGNMFQFYRDFEKEFRANRDINLARKLNPSLQNFEAWLSKNSSKIPLG